MNARVRVGERTAYVLSTDLDGEPGTAYLARVPAGPPLVLTGTAESIWRAVVAGGTTDDVLRRVAAEADLPAEAIAGDVADFLDQLADRGLIETEPAGP